MNTYEEVRDNFNRGKKVKYVFFWGHTPKSNSSIDKSCFSQWFDSPFEEGGVSYQTAEHYMMAKKALLFNDNDIYKQALEASNPGEAKHLGRSIRNFNEELWLKHRFEIVVNGSIAKFSQSEALTSYLVGTANRVLVKASPRDNIWGIGMDESDSNCTNPNLWKGLNLLGFALMKARAKLAENDV